MLYHQHTGSENEHSATDKIRTMQNMLEADRKNQFAS